MAPTIHLVRHAQGVHNLSIENESIHDPDLTPLGVDQCVALRAAFTEHDKITHLVASPLRRTLHTCINSFGKDALYPVKALDVLQEVSEAPCDTGSTPAELTAEFGSRVDVSSVDPAWTEKSSMESKFVPTVAKLTARATESRRALREIAGQGDGHVVAVSHGGFLHFLTNDWHEIPEGRATAWSNCECRSYQFIDPTGQDEEAELQETEESWNRRHEQAGKPPSLTEQRQIMAAVQKSLIPHLHLKG